MKVLIITLLLVINLDSFSQQYNFDIITYIENWKLDESKFENKNCFNRINNQFIQIKSFLNKSNIEKILKKSNICVDSVKQMTILFSMYNNKKGGVYVSLIWEIKDKYSKSYLITSKKVVKKKSLPELKNMINLEFNYQCIDSYRDTQPIIGINFKKKNFTFTAIPFYYYP